MTATIKNYELNQEATGGPVLPFCMGDCRRHHLLMGLFFIVLFMCIVLVTVFNLAAFEQVYPDRAHLEMMKAMCAEWSKQVVSNIYFWDEQSAACRVLELKVLVRETY